MARRGVFQPAASRFFQDALQLLLVVLVSASMFDEYFPLEWMVEESEMAKDAPAGHLDAATTEPGLLTLYAWFPSHS